MFRKLVIIGMVMGLAGMAMSAKYIGNPSSSNGWSTTSAVTIKIPATGTYDPYGDPCAIPTPIPPHWDWDPTWLGEVYTACYDPCNVNNITELSVINGRGLDPATGTKHSTVDWLGRYEDANAQYNCSFVMQNKSSNPVTAAGLGYYSDADLYEDGILSAGVTTGTAGYNDGGMLWFAFEFDQSYYVGDMLVWNYNEIASSITSGKPEYSTKMIKVSYTDSTSTPYEWNEQRQWTLSAGDRKSWTRGDDGMYSQPYPLDGQARIVVVTIMSNYATGSQNKYRAGLSEVHFEKDPNRATNFFPRPVEVGSTGGNLNTNSVDAMANPLTWTAGKGSNIVKHRVYISTDLAAVNNRTAFSAIVTTTSYYPNVPRWDGLTSTQYNYYQYWTVDELDVSSNVVAGGSGRAMKIRPLKVAWIEDFESYTTLYGSNPIRNEWKDGWSTQYYNSGDDKTHYLNGALVENGRTAYPSYVSRYMTVQYDNDGTWNYPDLTPWGPCDNNYSEVTAKAEDLLAGKDWITNTGGDGQIWLYVKGDAGNDVNEPLTMIVKDDAGHSASTDFTKYNPTSWLADGAWHWWIIDIDDFRDAGVDLTDVNTVTIRIGDDTGSGHGILYFDHFRMYPPLCPTSGWVATMGSAWPGNASGKMDPALAAGDLNDDCAINMKDMAIMANNWLAHGDTP